MHTNKTVYGTIAPLSFMENMAVALMYIAQVAIEIIAAMPL
jgi:hypothetical protein